MINKRSIANDYFYAACTCGIIITLLSVVFSVQIYFSEKKELYSNILDASYGAERVMSESFNYSEELAKFVGFQIIDNVLDNEKISKILKGSILTSQAAKNVFSYTIFDWANDEKKIIVSGPYGILKNPKDISFRNYAKEAKNHPWKLYFDHPDYGVPSGKYVLPAGMGITNRTGDFLGILSMGFNLSSLKEMLERKIQNININFVVLSKDMKLLFKSDNAYLPSDEQLRSIFAEKDLARYLDNEIENKSTKYVYYKKFSQYPFYILIGYDKEKLQDKLYGAIFWRLIELFLIGVVMLSFLLVTRKKLLLPILKLSELAKKISSGAFPSTIPKFSSFEMNILANQLKKIIDYTHELTSVNSDLEHKVQERTIELQKALRVKTDFLNNMSHEIRTPLQGFMGISEGLDLNWNIYSDSQKHKYIHEIAKNAKRLASLIGNLLDLAKFNEGKVILDISKLDLNQSIKDMIDESNTLYLNNKRIEFIFNYNSINNLYIMADSERISQVFRNLFVNAIKFSPNHGKIIIDVLEDVLIYKKNKIEAIRLSITDQGIGIPKDELESIFDLFVQSSRTRTRAGGTGLGLSICRDIILAHHGKIWAENSSEGGAIFHFVIPKEQLGQESTDKKEIDRKINTILVVDDEEAILSVMEIILSINNYNVLKASGGIEGLKLIKEYGNKIDLIFLDLMMPDIYGVNVLEKIKENEVSKNIPVIIQSGTSDRKEIQKCFDLGAEGFLAKPYNSSDVLKKIKEIY